MTTLEMLVFWITVGCYVGASLFYLAWLVFGGVKGSGMAKTLIGAGLISNIIVIIVRTTSTGHLPVKTAYELNLILAVITVLIFLYMEYKIPGIRLTGVICIPFAFIALGLGLTTAADTAPLTPAYKSSWLVIHVLFALIATACFVFAAGTSFLYLKKSSCQKGLPPDQFKNLPPLDILEELSFKLILVGFLAETIMLLSGSIWAKLLWGSFWSWDPIESWSLVSWLVYGIYLHLRVSFKWQGRKMAWLCIGCLFINLLSFWFVGLVTPDTYHNLEQIKTPWTKD